MKPLRRFAPCPWKGNVHTRDPAKPVALCVPDKPRAIE